MRGGDFPRRGNTDTARRRWRLPGGWRRWPGQACPGTGVSVVMSLAAALPGPQARQARPLRCLGADDAAVPRGGGGVEEEGVGCRAAVARRARPISGRVRCWLGSARPVLPGSAGLGRARRRGARTLWRTVDSPLSLLSSPPAAAPVRSLYPLRTRTTTATCTQRPPRTRIVARHARPVRIREAGLG